MPEDNVLTSKCIRGENIIQHPQESYVEVSTRSIMKLRSYAKKSKKRVLPTLSTVTLSLWTTCLGALLGYLPDLFAIFQGKSDETFPIVFWGILCICIISFIVWRVLSTKSNHSLFQLIEIIEDELDEDRVPINSASITKNIDTTNIITAKETQNSISVNLKGGNSYG